MFATTLNIPPLLLTADTKLVRVSSWTFTSLMSALVGKAGKKVFARHLERYGPTDPLYETYTNEKGKQKRRERALPPGLSKRDARILKSVQKRAHHLDKGFHVCGFRFGWNVFIGVIPFVGDVTNMSLNHFLVIRKAKQADVPPRLLRQMKTHNVVSTAFGFIPVVGDVVVAVYKVNSRNAALLEEFLRGRGEEFLKDNPGEDGRSSRIASTNGGRRNGSAWFRRKGASTKDGGQVKPSVGPAKGVAPSASRVDDLVHGGSSTNHGAIYEEPMATSASRNDLPPQEKSRKFSLFGGGKQTKDSVSHSPSEGRFVEGVASGDTPMRTK